MSIIYIFSLILIFVLGILMKKSKEKVEIISVLTIFFTLVLPYNTFVSYIFNLINLY